MANITIVATGGLAAVELSEEDNKDFLDTYEALKAQGSRVIARSQFSTVKEASEFASKAAAWANQNGKSYYRRNAKADPTIVQFRLYDKRASDDAAGEDTGE